MTLLRRILTRRERRAATARGAAVAAEVMTSLARVDAALHAAEPATAIVWRFAGSTLDGPPFVSTSRVLGPEEDAILAAKPHIRVTVEFVNGQEGDPNAVRN